MQKQKATEEGLCLVETYFGDSVRRTKNYLRKIMLLLPSVFNFFYLNRNQYFIQTSRIVNFTKAIENWCFILHNMFFHPDSDCSLRTLCTSIARDMRNTINMQEMQ